MVGAQEYHLVDKGLAALEACEYAGYEAAAYTVVARKAYGAVGEGLSCHGLAYVVQQCGHAQHRVGAYAVDRGERVLPHRAEVIVALCHVEGGAQLGYEQRYGSCFAQQPEGHCGAGREQQFLELTVEALGRYYGEAVAVALHGLEGGGVYVPAVFCGEAYGAEYAHGVVVECGVGLHGRAYDVCLEVGEAAAREVEYLACGYVLIQGVDGEVAA